MSEPIRKLRETLKTTQAQLELAMRAEFPIGARISVLRNGHQCIGTVEAYRGWSESLALIVRMERTGQVLEIGLWGEPEVLA